MNKTSPQIDKNTGKWAVFCNTTGEMKWVDPVDAKEHLALGVSTLEPNAKTTPQEVEEKIEKKKEATPLKRRVKKLEEKDND